MDDQPSSPPRGDATRARILEAAIAVFGRHGKEASTRLLAREAGANIQAIQYHFGGKDGLYLAAAEAIAHGVGARLLPAAEAAGAKLAAGTCGPDEARNLLAGFLAQAAQMAVSPESEHWARFVFREQMEPSPAFDVIYAQVMQPIMASVRRLVAAISGGEPEDQAVGLQAVAIVGQVMVFRFARAAVLRQLEWQATGEPELGAIRTMLRASVRALPQANPTPEIGA